MTRQTILVTFAGREDRMALLRQHVTALLDVGLVDEWHVWDFTRTEQDRAHVAAHYGPVRYIRPGAGYQPVGQLGPGRQWHGVVAAGADLHVLIRSRDGALILEYVLGGWGNRVSVIRRLDESAIAHGERGDAEILFQAVTPSLLCPQARDRLSVVLTGAGELVVSLPHFAFPALPLGELAGEVEVEVEVALRGGSGSAVELFGPAAPVARFVGDRGARTPYWQAYQYYRERYERYREAVFLKCDDDIVYVQEDGVAGFLHAIEAHPELFILSANVVNNGVCAHFQQQAGHVPDSLGRFENPEGGFGGSLWEDGKKAHRLHEHFVSQGKPVWPLAARLVEVPARLSINFIGWRGEMLRYMQVTPDDDDEYMLSVALPQFLGKKVAIMSDFMVSHLSFFPQEDSIEPAGIVALYGEG